MKICFLLTHVPNPRINKRIVAIKGQFNITVVCIRRRSSDIWEPHYTDIQHTVFDIDYPSSTRLFFRYIMFRKFRKKAYKQLDSERPDILYVEGLDALIIATHYIKKNCNVKLVYEVADIREVYFRESKNVVEKCKLLLLKYVEDKYIPNMDLLVVTSEKFYEDYYYRYIPKYKSLHIPNIPDLTFFKSYQKREYDNFTVGFIGSIRYLQQMKNLVDASAASNLNVLFAGSGVTDSYYEEIREYCKNYEHVVFTGRYDYAKEIADLYGRVNCVYAVYDADNPNVCIALPNKLYESIFCELPIIVAKGTYLAELVEKWGVGVAVTHYDKIELIEALNRLSTDKSFYDGIVSNCIKMKDTIDISKYYHLLAVAMSKLT